MTYIFYVAIIIFLICTAVYCTSFGIWTWKRKNRLGALAVFLVAAIVIVLPLYALFFKS